MDGQGPSPRARPVALLGGSDRGLRAVELHNMWAASRRKTIGTRQLPPPWLDEYSSATLTDR